MSDPVYEELKRLRRLRDVVVRHLTHVHPPDVPGALSALYTERDNPELFDRMRFEGE